MSTKEDKFHVVMSYDTCGANPTAAVNTMLSAIKEGSVSVDVYDGDGHSVWEGDLHELLPKRPPDKPVPPPRLKTVEHSRYYTVRLSESDAQIVDWDILLTLATGRFRISGESYNPIERLIGFHLPVDEEIQLPHILNMIEEHIEANKSAAFEDIEGFGSF